MIKRLTLSLSIVLLALIMGLAWLMMTDAGFRVLLGAVKPLLPVALEYRELEGNLLRGVSFERENLAWFRRVIAVIDRRRAG